MLEKQRANQEIQGEENKEKNKKRKTKQQINYKEKEN